MCECIFGYALVELDKSYFRGYENKSFRPLLGGFQGCIVLQGLRCRGMDSGFRTIGFMGSHGFFSWQVLVMRIFPVKRLGVMLKVIAKISRS